MSSDFINLQTDVSSIKYNCLFSLSFDTINSEIAYNVSICTNVKVMFACIWTSFYVSSIKDNSMATWFKFSLFVLGPATGIIFYYRKRHMGTCQEDTDISSPNCKAVLFFRINISSLRNKRSSHLNTGHKWAIICVVSMASNHERYYKTQSYSKYF
jgi:hypothetical protein